MASEKSAQTRFHQKSPFLPAKLILEDKTIFHGKSFGCPESATGETVFNTGMVGYEQSLTDPSYFGQLLCFTYPMIGNYGVAASHKNGSLSSNWESDQIRASGVIVSEYAESPSHWKSQQTLNQWLFEQKIPGICGIDTRSLTQHLRTKGTMLGKIVVQNQTVDWFDPNQINCVNAVSTPKIRRIGNYSTSVVLIDCGAKNNIVRSLLNRKISVTKVPWNYDFLDSGLAFDGVIVSNGPGDPTKCPETIRILQKTLRESKPVFGICLGHQLTALAIGAKTYRLKFGHRGQNQPCRLIGENRGFITSQNHGFAVDAKTLPRHWNEWFVNLNDGSNEGIRHDSKPFCSVQFHPEATPGPNDTNFLFDNFRKELRK